MKKIAVLVFVVVLSASLAHAAEMKSFLLENYGWTIDLSKHEKHWYSFYWDLDCDSDRIALPKKGKKTSFNWVCRQKDPAYWTVIIWRLPSVNTARIEEMVFKDFSEGYSCSSDCKTQVLPSAVDPEGLIKDCRLSICGDVRYAAFYHFKKTLSDNTMLGFTIYVRNGPSQSSDVGEKLRELVSAMQIVP